MGALKNLAMEVSEVTGKPFEEVTVEDLAKYQDIQESAGVIRKDQKINIDYKSKKERVAVHVK